MFRVAALLLSAALTMLAPAVSQAARSTPGAAIAPSGYELILFEVDGCVYCDVFRRDVLPLYSASEVSRRAPLRFVNLTHADHGSLKLTGAITIAPTIVLLYQGREVNRIIGYTGPSSFLKLIHLMMGQPN